MFVRIGSNMPPVRTVEEDEERIAELLRNCPVGGLVLFNGSFAETPADARATAATQPISAVGGCRLRARRGATAGRLSARSARDGVRRPWRRCGGRGATLRRIDRRGEPGRGGSHPFAPVSDVNSDPRNPIIATRAFGTEPERVARVDRRVRRGCRAGGALPTAKHFPGHGNTDDDSHHALPTVAATRAELDATRLAAVSCGHPGGRTAGHDGPRPVTRRSIPPAPPRRLSHAILTRLLRDELGFQGARRFRQFLDGRRQVRRRRRRRARGAGSRGRRRHARGHRRAARDARCDGGRGGGGADFRTACRRGARPYRAAQSALSFRPAGGFDCDFASRSNR